MNYSVVLASASPRRTMLLDQMGIAHSVKPVDIDESALANETPEAQVARLAEQKAKTALARLHDEDALNENTRVLASDTHIAFNGVSLGKPEDKEDARRILSMLSNNEHEVLTAISVASTTKQVTQTITTKVTFAA